MKKRTRILQATLTTLAALLLLLLFIVLFWLGPAVKLITEIVGEKALGTPIEIQSLSINPRKGLINLSGFAIANPADFSQSNSVSLASLDIAIDMGSIFTQTVTVHQVQIHSPHFTFEQSSASDNIAEYILNVADFIGYDHDAPPEPPNEKKELKKKEKAEKRKKQQAEKSAKIVVVEALEIHDVQFRLTHTDNPELDILIGLEHMSVSMTNGIVRLDKLHVNNPGRLQSEDLFSLDGLRITLEPATIHYPPLAVRDVQLTHPHFFVEWAHDASTVSELLAISSATQARVMQWPLPKKHPAAKPQEPPPAPPAEAEATPPPPEIHHVGITDFQFHLVNSIDTNLSIRVMLDHLDIGLREGHVESGRFSISNPGRLALPDLFSLDGISIRFDPATIHSDTISVLDVQLRRPYAFLESNPETDTVAELVKIANTITGNLPASGIAGAATSAVTETIPAEPVKSPAAPPVALHNLLVDDLQVKLLDTTGTNAPSDPSMLAGIGSISIKLVEGKVQLSSITVPNPDGFHAANLFHLGTVDISIDPGSVFSDQMRIRRVFIDSPTINLEQTETTGNGAELQKSLMAFIPPAPETPAADTPVRQAAAESVPLAEHPVVLETLLVTNLAIHAILPPPAVAATNDSAAGLMGRLELDTLRPMTHMQRGRTNETASVKAEGPTLLAFDLLTIEPLKGSVVVSNLRIGNPEGFANEHLVRLPQFSLRLDPDTLPTDTLLIREIRIEKPSVAYERKITTDNIKAFQQTIEKAFARREATVDQAMEKTDIEPGKEQKVIIEHLLVQNGIVRAKLSALPTAPIPLPTIEMNNIGKAEGGASLGEASGKIFSAFYDAIIGVVANATGLAGDALKGAGALTFDAFGNLTGSLGGLMGVEGMAPAEKTEPSDSEKKKRRSLFRGRTHK